MGREIFEARWNCLQGLRAQGHMDLEDYMGAGESLIPLMEAGLLTERDLQDEWQRYQKMVPTVQGERYFIHDKAHHVIVVRRTQLGALSEALRAHRGVPVPAVAALPVTERLQRVDAQLATANDTWSLVRFQELRRWIQKGYMDLEHFREQHKVTEEMLLRSWICERRERSGRHGTIQLVPMLDGMIYLKRVDAWEMVLVKPGMEEQLLAHCTPGRTQHRVSNG
jgi:hypothetical protein